MILGMASPTNPTAQTPPNLLTYIEAADLLGVKLATLYSLVSRRAVPHVRFSGRMVRFEPAALAEYIAARRVDAAEGQ